MEVERLKKGLFKTTKIQEQEMYTRKKKKISSLYLDCMFIFLVSLVVRMFRIERGGFVLWDEAHFGKFAGHYLNREFFFDVHPPLGKLLTALSGWIVGMNKSFAFSSGDAYTEDVDYVGMRIFHCLFGSAVPVCGYIILRTLLIPRSASICVSLGLVFENALVSVSRLILLDSFLVFFICLSEVFLARIVMQNHRVERIGGDLVCLGVSIGCAMSVKWVGFLTVAHVGIFAVYILLQEIRKRRTAFFSLFYRLAVTLIVIPVCVYMFTFYVHFWVLNRSGPGDGEMSSRFQSFLHNNEVLENDIDLLYGNKVTIRNNRLGTGLLHSHIDRYPIGGQQVTSYPHKDSNNHWRILKVGTDAGKVNSNEDLVIHHTETNTYLTVNEIDARTSSDPETELHEKYAIPEDAKKVMCMSNEEMNNSVLSNAVFHFEPVQNEDAVHPLTTHFYIKSTQYNCYLKYTGNKLPAWGHQQGEILCTPEKGSGSVWNIEMNRSEEGISQSMPPKALNFFEFIRSAVELNVSMNTANNSLKDDGKDTFGSLPLEWLLPKKWLKLNRWDGVVPRFAMVGNIFTWYAGTLSLCILFGYFLLGLTRKIKTLNKYNTRRSGRMYILLGGWAFHYLPFLMVTRILYLHHYLPCLFFGLLGIAILAEKRKLFAYTYALLVTACFIYFAPITYGYSGAIENMPGYKLFGDWWNIYTA
ncbi:hypothetical protein NERG_00340 [Nematocida ausubeli]|uniref:Dolichyl-phosphate-mannose--protein mannosyltransferase n=1 Tax=Nematocida ausubeli (strain ATCC PRA-371 / ERTm2) TaxID=1913371 RepID=H8Z9R9_NEMA1|nr:hypothetical protein NERG_00340 [Nematocida ausubeli]